MEEIQQLKCQLESDVSSSETILSALKTLGSKNVSKEVLLSTKIGHTVNQLRRQGSSEEIREQAKLVFRRWREFIRDSEKEKPLIEVRCDKKTEVLRGKARQFLTDALQVAVWSVKTMFTWDRFQMDLAQNCDWNSLWTTFGQEQIWNGSKTEPAFLQVQFWNHFV